jgi:hypothetical protein
MNRPLEEFLYHCRREGSENDPNDYVAWHLKHAHVYSGPDAFAMAVECNLAEFVAGWLPPRPTLGPVNCWCITAAAGCLEAAIFHLPHPLPYVAFYRSRRGKKRLAFYAAARLKALCHMTT